MQREDFRDQHPVRAVEEDGIQEGEDEDEGYTG